MSLGTENAAIALPISFPKPVNDAIRRSPLSSLADFFGLDFVRLRPFGHTFC